MAENPILHLWSQALQSGRDIDSMRRTARELAATGAISSDHIAAGTAVLGRDEQGNELSADARILLAATLFEAGQMLPSLGDRMRFGTAAVLWQTIPGSRLDLLRLKAEAAQAALAHAPVDLPETSKATLLADYGACLAQIGQSRQALDPLRDAVAIYRPLGKAFPEVFESHLAIALNALASVFRDLGDWPGAQPAFEEALHIFRRLADPSAPSSRPFAGVLLEAAGLVPPGTGHDPSARAAAYLPYVAHTLNNLGVVQSDLGDRPGARASYKEALEIYRQLASGDPTGFDMYVSIALTNLGKVLLDQGHRSEARQCLEQALDIRRRSAPLDAAAPDPDVARILNNLGLALRESRELPAARATLEEALTIRRRLAEADPVAFEADVATTANNLGKVLHDMGERLLARSAMEEALTIRRRLALAEPAAFDRHVATTLNNLGILLRDLGERLAARDQLEEALEIRSRLASAQDAAFKVDLADTQAQLGTVLSDLADWSAAREMLAKAVETWRSLAEAETDAFAPDLARSQNDLGKVLRLLGNRKAARAAHEKALVICRQLVQSEPGAFELQMAQVLSNLGNVLRELGDGTEARAALEEALAIRRTLATRDPVSFATGVAHTLTNIGCLLKDMDDPDGALTAFEEAAEKTRHAEPFVRAHILMHLAVETYDQGDQRRGLDTAWEAVELVEAALRGPKQTEARHAFKGEMEPAYRLVLCDPALDDDPARTERVIESFREGEMLALPNPRRSAESEPRPCQETCAGTLLAVQCTHEGMLFVAQGDHHICARADATWVDAGQHLLDEICRAEEELLAALGARRNPPDRTAGIARAGQQLWGLTPKPIQDLLDSSSTGEITLSMDSQAGVLPIELLTPTGRPDDFLCLKLEMPRVPGQRLFHECLERAAIGATDRPLALIFGNPWHSGASNLGLAERQARQLAAALEKKGFGPALEGKQVWAGPDARAREFIRGLRSDPSIVHFTGHGTTTGRDECLLLAGSDMLFADGLLEQAEGFSQHPLVLLDSCRTGRVRAHGGAFRGLPIAFLRLGAAAVVASVFPLYEGPAAAFANRFYENLLGENLLGGKRVGEAMLNRHTVGEAMLQTRKDLFSGGENVMHWSRPILYGNARAQLSLPEKA